MPVWLIEWLMANELTAISAYLGRNIATLRKSRSMSQQQLAKLAGVPRSTLTYLESGQGNPSLQNLVKVAASLQVSIEELLSRPRAQCKLIKAKDVPVQKRSQGVALLRKLLPDNVPGMEIDRIEIDRGGRMGGVPHTANTKEYLICIEGSILVHVAGEKYALEAGDVLAFPGDQHHSYQNIGNGKAHCLSVVAIAPHGV